MFLLNYVKLNRIVLKNYNIKKMLILYKNVKYAYNNAY